MTSAPADVLPEAYAPAQVDPAWLAAVTDATSWRAVSHAMPPQVPFPHLDTGTLREAGVAPLFDLGHEQTAWFYNIVRSVSEAHLNPAPMTFEQRDWFGFDRAVLFTHEKRAIAHRGNLLRLWPAHSDAGGAYVLVCAPSVAGASTRDAVDGLITPLSTTDLPAAIRAAVVASARMDDAVLLARTVERTDLW